MNLFGLNCIFIPTKNKIMITTKLNKVMAGYHMLMILSDVDGEVDKNEGIT